MMLKVSVAIALPSHQEVVELELPEGSTVAQALAAARLPERFPALEVASLSIGVWSRPCDPGTPLRDGDRVELYRPLRADAKARRRARAALTPASPRSRRQR